MDLTGNSRISRPWVRALSLPARREALSALQVSLYAFFLWAGSLMVGLGERRPDACSWASQAGSSGGGVWRMREGSIVCCWKVELRWVFGQICECNGVEMQTFLGCLLILFSQPH